MDHLLLPAGATFTEDDAVPCLAEKDYLKFSFRDYAIHCGFPHAVSRVQGLDYEGYERLHPTPKPQLQKFWQTWAFFCLLREFLGSEDFEHSDFVQDRAAGGQHGRFVCTKKLPGLAKRRMSKFSGDNEKIDFIERFNTCAALVSRAMSVSGPRLDLILRLSLRVMFETICKTVKRVDAMKIRFIEDTDLFTNEELGYRIRANGWCPNEARFILRRLGSLWSASAMFYASKLQRGHTTKDHRQCTPDQCFALQIVPSKYKVSHRNEECQCKVIHVKTYKLNKILRSGQLPLLNLVMSKDGQTCRKAKLVASDGNMPYVALSHVWADGLGNPFENALHACQLVQLRRLATDLFEKSSTARDLEMPAPLIWLDTLCCPSKPGPGKNIAMGMMRQVYRQASHVLVLDDTLRSQECYGMDVLEAASRIFIAPWNRRLWCLQEGALPKSLWFQFKDTAIEFCTIFGELETVSRDVGAVSASFSETLVNLSMSLRFFGLPSSVEGRASPKLHWLMKAVERREVSVRSDEALCLAAMFNLDVGALVKESGASQRMAMWWAMLCEEACVPSDIIFARAPKLELDRFRWAPASLLGHYIELFDDKISVLSSRGLEVRYEGLSLAPGRIVGYEVQHAVQLKLSKSAGLCTVRDQQRGRWYGLSLPGHEALSDLENRHAKSTLERITLLSEIVSAGSARLILDKKPDDQKVAIGLLVKRKDVTSGCHFVSQYFTCNLVEHSSRNSSMLDHAFQIAESVRQDDATATLAQERALHSDLTTAMRDPSFFAAAKTVMGLIKSELSRVLAANDDRFLNFLSHHHNSIDDGLQMMHTMIWGLYWNIFLDIDHWYSSDTLWCVD